MENECSTFLFPPKSFSPFQESRSLNLSLRAAALLQSDIFLLFSWSQKWEESCAAFLLWQEEVMAAESNLAALDFQIDAEGQRRSQPMHLAWTGKKEPDTLWSKWIVDRDDQQFKLFRNITANSILNLLACQPEGQIGYNLEIYLDHTNRNCSPTSVYIWEVIETNCTEQDTAWASCKNLAQILLCTAMQWSVPEAWLRCWRGHITVSNYRSSVQKV